MIVAAAGLTTIVAGRSEVGSVLQEPTRSAVHMAMNTPTAGRGIDNMNRDLMRNGRRGWQGVRVAASALSIVLLGHNW
jgi:hypothetical protein